MSMDLFSMHADGVLRDLMQRQQQGGITGKMVRGGYGLYPCPFWPGAQSHTPYITNTHTNSRRITRESFLAACGGHSHANACSPMHKYAYFLHLSFVFPIRCYVSLLIEM